MKVTLKSDTFISGKPVAAGSTLDVSIDLARQLAASDRLEGSSAVSLTEIEWTRPGGSGERPSFTRVK